MILMDTDSWYLERIIWLMAGIIVLITLILALFVSQWFLIITALIGLNLAVMALTGFCPTVIILKKLGIKSKIAK